EAPPPSADAGEPTIVYESPSLLMWGSNIKDVIATWLRGQLSPTAISSLEAYAPPSQREMFDKAMAQLTAEGVIEPGTSTRIVEGQRVTTVTEGTVQLTERYLQATMFRYFASRFAPVEVAVAAEAPSASGEQPS